VLADDGAADFVSVARRVRRPAVTFRRSPHLVAFWRDGSLRVSNYATRTTAGATPLVCELLDFCEDWRTIDEIQQGLSSGQSSFIPALAKRLVELDFLEQSDRPVNPRVLAMDKLARWNPEAGFFHMATRDVPFASPQKAARHARLQSARVPRPPVVKRYRGVETLDLPRPDATGEFPEVLKARRTWRRYSSSPVTLPELATVLAFTAGIQQWVHVGSGRTPLKTSPSGGARHPIECYVVSRTVDGLKPGIYHYAADRHALEKLRGPVPLPRMEAYLPNSGYFAKASAMVFFTAIFDRISWRYPYSRAYRAALVEAGHLCQTFCLTATWQGLAPYCVMGLADSLIEQDLGLDGISEAVLYAAGVGRPPRGSTWAPLPRGTLTVRRNPRV
jgi:SagB-type dehydrogenase family enzyme